MAPATKRSLLESAEESGPATKVAKMKSLTLSQHVCQRLRDNFRTWDIDLIDGRISATKLTLREQLTKDTLSWLDVKTPVMGSNYYELLKLTYGETNDFQLTPLSETEKALPVNPKLNRAASKYTADRRDTALMLAYASTMKEANKRDRA